MIDQKKRVEFWNYLTTEKNQPRPKGITVQRLAVIKPAIIGLDELWTSVVVRHGAADRDAAEFYRSNEPSAMNSRAEFWEGIRSHIRRSEYKSDDQTRPINQGVKSRRNARPRGRR